MTERQYVDRAEQLWPHDSSVASEALEQTVREGLIAFPESAHLWYIRGLIHELETMAGRQPFNPGKSLAFFKRSIRYNRLWADPYTECGFIYDTYSNEFKKAENYFRRSIFLGGGWDAYLGLARVLAEMGRTAEALRAVDQGERLFPDEPRLRELQEEIRENIWSPETGNFQG